MVARALTGYETVGREEFISARLYTGPMYLKYNAVLRGLNNKAPEVPPPTPPSHAPPTP